MTEKKRRQKLEYIDPRKASNYYDLGIQVGSTNPFVVGKINSRLVNRYPGLVPDTGNSNGPPDWQR